MLVLFAAFSLRILYTLLFFSSTHIEAEDQLLYLSLAESISNGSWSAITPERTPGYPIFLAAVFFFFGQEYWPVLIIQALIDALTCILIGLLAIKVFGRGGVLAGMLAAINLNMIVLSAMVLTDSLFLFLLTWSLLLAVSYIRECKPAYFISAIALLGLATMIRSAGYYLIPLLMMALLVAALSHRSQMRDLFSMIVVSLLALGATLSPQHLRNWNTYQSTAFISQGGTHLLGWVVPAVYQYSGKGSYEEGQGLSSKHLKAHMVASGMTTLPPNPFEASSFQSTVAVSMLQEFGMGSVLKAWVVGNAINMAAPSAAFAPVVRSMEHPSFYATPGNGAFEKLWNYVTDTSGWLYLSILVTGTLTSLVFCMLFAVGWLFALRDKLESGRQALLLLTLVLLYFFAVTGPIIGSKYRLPIEPVMTIFVTYAILRFADRWRVR